MASHLKEYLEYYNTCDAPGYAVLVTGEWGSGKTFQVNQILDEKDRYYVSLFGLKTASDVYSEVLAVVDPQLSTTRTLLENAGDTAKNMGGLFALGGALTGLMNSALRHKLRPDKTLIFDDLERCKLDLQEILGVINTYVEHQKCRIVVIAHDEKTVKGFDQAKEKLFGQTIKVEPQIIPAFEKFCGDISCPKKRDFISNHQNDIISTFQESGIKSLRILRHVIEDLARLYENLSVVHLDNSEAMRELVSLFTAMNIEIRDNKLTEGDLKDRLDTQVGYQMNANSNKNDKREKPPLIIADDKYTFVDLTNTMLQDDLLIQMLTRGCYNCDAIRNSLKSSPYFLKAEDSAPWEIVIKFDTLEDDIVSSAADKMQLQFDKREVTNSGELLHIFSLRMMMAEKGILSSTISEEADAAKKYIDDVLAAGKLPPRETDWEWDRNFKHAHHGTKYWLTEATKVDFKKVFNYLVEAREKALELYFPQESQRLLELIKTDGRAFFEQVNFTNNGDNPYAVIPILPHISAKDFVEAWLGSPHKNWCEVLYALTGRYEGARLQRELVVEKDWLQEVVEILKDKVTKATGFNAFRIQRLIPNLSFFLDSKDG